MFCILYSDSQIFQLDFANYGKMLASNSGKNEGVVPQNDQQERETGLDHVSIIIIMMSQHQTKMTILLTANNFA